MTNTHKMETAQGSETLLGAVIAWDLGHGSATALNVDRSALRSALSQCGFDPGCVEEALDAEDAVRFAAQVSWSQYAQDGQRYQITALPTAKGSLASFGVLHKTESEEDARMTVGARIRVNPLTHRPEVAPPLDAEYHEGSRLVAEAATANAIDRMSRAFNSEFVAALSHAHRSVFAVSMRANAGGAYFVPAGERCDRMLALLDALEVLTERSDRASKFVANVTIVHGDERSVKSWSRQVTYAFEDEVTQLQSALAAMAARDNVRDATWDARQADAVALMLRADEFSTLLGGRLADIKSSLATLEQEFGNAKEAAARTVGRARGALAALDALAGKAAAKPSKASKADALLAKFQL